MFMLDADQRAEWLSSVGNKVLRKGS